MDQIVCTVKEFEGPSTNSIESISSEDSHRAIRFSNSLFVNSLSEARNDVYIHLGKVSLTFAQNFMPDYLLVAITSSSGQTLFSNASNATPQKSWESLASFNNEVIGEVIKCNNFDKNEMVYLSLYASGQFLAQGCIPLWHGNRVWSGKRNVNFVRDGVNVAQLNTLLDFVGNGYNTDVSIEKILNWKLVYEKNGVDELTATLAKFKVIEDTEFLKVSCVDAEDFCCFFSNFVFFFFLAIP